jgi:hypothetical protein
MLASPEVVASIVRLFPILIVACLLVGHLPAQGAGLPALPPQEIARDDVAGSTGAENDTTVEPDVAVDPRAPSIVVAAYQAGRFPDGGGAVAIGHATSHDGGVTWQAETMPGLTIAAGGPFLAATDPVVAIGPDGSVYVEALALYDATFPCRSAVAVQRSIDGGTSFAAPVLVEDDRSCAVFNDKDWLAVDTSVRSPHLGRLYTAWAQKQGSNQPLLLRRSDDDGSTWGDVVTLIDAAGPLMGALPVVQPDGALTVVYRTLSTPAVRSTTSRDGGDTFDAPITVDRIDSTVAPDLRPGDDPTATVDAVTGQLSVAWRDGRWRSDGLNDIVLSSSVDGGRSWGKLVRVNPDPPNSGLDHFTPAVAARGGVVHVTYRTRDEHAGLSPLVDMRYVASTDSGQTFNGEEVLGDPSDLRAAAVVTTREEDMLGTFFFLGDYMGLAVSSAAVHPVWCRSSLEPGVPPGMHETVWAARLVPPFVPSQGPPPLPTSPSGTMPPAFKDACNYGAPTCLPGDGAAATACLVEVVVAGARGGRSVDCVDNDPTCDADPRAGRCEFLVSWCFNNSDPRLACSSAGLTRVVVRHLPHAARKALREELARLPGASGRGESVRFPRTLHTANLCTAPIRVPVSLPHHRARGSSIGQAIIWTHGAGPQGMEPDQVVLRCEKE